MRHDPCDDIISYHCSTQEQLTDLLRQVREFSPPLRLSHGHVTELIYEDGATGTIIHGGDPE